LLKDVTKTVPLRTVPLHGHYTDHLLMATPKNSEVTPHD
jgi:hypothetical protein